MEPTSYIVSQRSNPDPQSIEGSSLSFFGCSLVGISLLTEAFVLALDSGPCLSQGLIALSFTDRPKALGVLSKDQATSSTFVPDQAVPAKLIDRADLLIWLLAEQLVKLLAGTAPFADLLCYWVAWAPTRCVIPGEGVWPVVFVVGCVMIGLASLVAASNCRLPKCRHARGRTLGQHVSMSRSLILGMLLL